MKNKFKNLYVLVGFSLLVVATAWSVPPQNPPPQDIIEAVVPSGMVAFFATPEPCPTGGCTCPVGWSLFPDLIGRVAVGLEPIDGTPYGMVGTPLTDLQDPVHNHMLSLPADSVAAAGGHSHNFDNMNEAGSHLHSTGAAVGNSQSAEIGPFTTEGVSKVTHTHNVITNGGHIHTGSTDSKGNHTHDINDVNTVVASKASVISYIQLLPCVKD